MTAPFLTLAHHAANAYDVPDARIVAVDHPLGGIAEDAVDALASSAIGGVLDQLTARSES